VARKVSHYQIIIVKTSSLKQSVTATRPTSHNYNSKYQKNDITFAAHFHNVNMLQGNSTFLIFAVLVMCRRYRLF